ncbi:MAG: hypothetical protein Tp172MES00d2C118482111_37 [Prokaryotic dsDNA virus sp.]|mgnify:CR=1 FL=1|nr:MAG: hypothetical protein Tp172MES00d2C118482111_37 [Prokaryotic dsDNA virus sp.]|tara:strand:+ start:3893 stop:4063 length:171 start_codon:yes stop_codon:yes gene_type:complete
MIDRKQLIELLVAWIISAFIVAGVMVWLGYRIGEDAGYTAGLEDGSQIITEICIKE